MGTGWSGRRSSTGFPTTPYVYMARVCSDPVSGEIMVALHNHGTEPQTVSDGERIAQLVITPFLRTDYCEADELSATERGTGGFGSTGKA